MSSQKITIELTVAEASALSHAAEAIKDDAAEAPDTFGWNRQEHRAYLRAIKKLRAAIDGTGSIAAHDRKEAAVLPVAKLYERVAWLQRHGAHQEANALRELAAWFEPPIRIDEAKVDRRMAELEAIARRLDDPVNWA